MTAPLFSGWTIARDLWSHVRPMLRPGLVTLETGSGLSTLLFDAAGCRHTALEHDPRFAAPSPSVVDVRLVGRPRWYDWKPSHPFDLILVDGPPKDRGPRSGILRVLQHCLHDETILILDDTHRKPERELADRIAAQFGRAAVHYGDETRGFSILRRARPVRRWAVGITTAPRPEPTLERTIQSLVDAGWPRMSVFAEPGSPLPAVDEDRIRIYQRPKRLGIWQNWITAVADLLAAEPEADALFLLQDDVQLCRDLRAYCEKTLWPQIHRVGLCSPYQPAPYITRKPRRPGWHLQKRGWYLVGALTWILPVETARSLLCRWANFQADRRLDARIGKWCSETGRSVWYHAPSLAEHLGFANSASGDGSRDKLRRAGDFIGADRSPPTPDP